MNNKTAVEDLKEYKEPTQLNGTYYYRFPVQKLEHIIQQAHQQGVQEGVERKPKSECCGLEVDYVCSGCRENCELEDPLPDKYAMGADFAKE